MVEFAIQAQRRAFLLDAKGAFEDPWTVLCGVSGSGKSLLLRVLAGLEEADAARISVHGRYVTDTETGLRLQPGLERGVGMVMQRPGLFPHLTVAGNVAYGLRGSSLAEVREGCEDLLEMVGVRELADRWPGALTSGEAQRVALARALAPAPRLLLLDDPLSALEAGERNALLGLLREAMAERKMQAIVATRDGLATQDRLDLLAGGGEVVRMREGRIVAISQP